MNGQFAKQTDKKTGGSSSHTSWLRQRKRKEQKARKTAVDAAFAKKARSAAIIAVVVANAHKTAIFAAVATHK